MKTINKLSKNDILELYSFLYEYETIIKNNAGHYHSDDSLLKNYIKDNNIFMGSLNKKTSKSNYIRCDMRQGRKVSSSDLCHHTFRHIRNAIAHGLLRKENNYFKYEDYCHTANGLKKSASLCLDIKKFWNFIDEMKKTYR